MPRHQQLARPRLENIDRSALQNYQHALTRPIALAIGGERQGLSKELRALAHTSATLPMPGQADSLNVSIATSTMICEWLRHTLKWRMRQVYRSKPSPPVPSFLKHARHQASPLTDGMLFRGWGRR